MMMVEGLELWNEPTTTILQKYFLSLIVPGEVAWIEIQTEAKNVSTNTL
jgi:hypothetical protein